jgi:two-component system sensor histidine kinase RegB
MAATPAETLHAVAEDAPRTATRAPASPRLHGELRSFMRLLCNLRWLGAACQALTIYIVTAPMAVDLRTVPLWGGVVVLVVFNLYVQLRVRRAGDPAPIELFGQLLVDIAVLAWQIAWSGGIENPFSSLFLLPIALSLLAMPMPWVWAIAATTLGGFALSVWIADPLPHVHSFMGDAFNLHKAGMLVNFVVSASVLLVFVARLATLWRARERELAALRESFTRNEGIIALATHAASVAHELNTPLATMTLIVEDLQAQDPREEHSTLQQLLTHCRDRVRALAAPANEAEARLTEVDTVVDRWQLVRPTIELHRSGALPHPQYVDAGIGHLLQALLNNAADASEQSGSTRIDLRLEIRDGQLIGEIRDYGPGFSSTSPVLPGTLFRTDKPEGLGIGLALSHATVERLGGELSMHAPGSGPGVIVSFRLPTGIRA